MKGIFSKKKVLLFGALTAACSSVVAQERPNVIFIMADDLGFGDMECYNGKESTPNLNEFAQGGCLFTNAYSVASTSTPSRYSLLTGKYSWRETNTGIAPGDAGMIISPETFTVADVFGQAGYHTAAFGKWHLGLGSRAGGQNWNGELDQALTELGFDDWQIMAATADRVPCVYIRGNSEKGGRKVNHGRVVNLDPKDPIRVSYTTAIGDSTWYDYPDAVKLAPRGPNDHHGATIVDSIPRIGHMTGGYAARWKDENIADTLVGRAVDFIRERAAGGDPFFIYLATNDIHVPRWPHARFRGKSKTGLRGDAILAFDWSVGQIMKTLKELNIDDNTMVIISSDNGPVLNDGYLDKAEELTHAAGHLISGGLRGGKYSSYEGGTRVPFLVRWPARVPKGKVSEAMVSQVDFLGTMAGLLQVNVPIGQAMDSQKAMAAWLGEDLTHGRDYIFQTTNSRKVSLRTRDWKFIPQGELFNMKETQLHNQFTPIHTPTEATNVASNNPEQVQIMKKILADEAAKATQFEVFTEAQNLLNAMKPSEVVVNELMRVDSLTTKNGLPGKKTGTQYHFSSEKLTLQEPTDVIRLTFTSTNTHAQGQLNPNKAYCPVGLAELKVMDEAGNVLALDAAGLSANNTEPREGALSYLIDGDAATYWHSTWSQATPEKSYLQIKLPKKVTAFSFSFVSKHAANVPQSILVSMVKQHIQNVPAKEVPQSYIDTLQHEYDRSVAHFGDESFVSHLHEVVAHVSRYLDYQDRLQKKSFLVDNVLAQTNLAYITEEELEQIRVFVEGAGDYEADCQKIKQIDAFFQPEKGAAYTLYNKKTKMFAGMLNQTTAARKNSVVKTEQAFQWLFTFDAEAGAYRLYNRALNMPVNRQDARESIYAAQAAQADIWEVVPRGDGFFNIRVVASKIASDRDCLNDNGQTVNAYADENDMGTSWQIVKVGTVETGIDSLNSDSSSAQQAESATKAVYNLNGQRVMVTDKGIYIVNGKKVYFP